MSLKVPAGQNLQEDTHEYKLKAPSFTDDEPTGYNPTKLDLIDLRAALRFSHGKVLATDNHGYLKFIDRGQTKGMQVFHDDDYLWDWTVKFYDVKFKHMFWLSCGEGVVHHDTARHTLILKFSDVNDLRDATKDETPAIFMVEPWSGHLQVFNPRYVKNQQLQPWLKVCDVSGSALLIPPNSPILEELFIKPVTMTSVAFCTRDKHLIFSKRVLKRCDNIRDRILNRQVPFHSDVSIPD